MNRVLLYLAALTLVSGGSLASTSTDVSSGAVLQSGLPALSAEQPELPAEWSVMAPGQPFTHAAVSEEVIHVAGKFKKGLGRDAGRGRPGRPGDPGGLRGGGHRDVDIDRRVDIDRDVNVDVDRDIDVDYDDDDHEVGAALIGIGIGAAIANSNDPDYTCVNSNCDY